MQVRVVPQVTSDATSRQYFWKSGLGLLIIDNISGNSSADS